ncbi:MAG: YceI family protein [Gemmatimonadales bacterium]
MRPVCTLASITIALVTLGAPLSAQQPDAFRPKATDSGEADDTAGRLTSGGIDPRLRTLDSVVYRLAPDSRLRVKTGKAGLFGFAGHTHLIQANGARGQVVYYPKAPSSSRLQITILTDSLEVLTPPDTAEIRKVTAAMRTEVLHTAEHPEMTMVSRKVTPTEDGFHLVAALTMAGQTRDVPIDVVVRMGPDSLRASATFSVKQTDFGIKPFRGGPGGTVKVADQVTFDIRVVAVRAK